MLMERVIEELQCENGIVKNANNLTHKTLKSKHTFVR